MGERGIGRRARDAHEIGMELEIAGDVLAGDRIAMRVHHEFVERTAAEGIHAFVSRDGAFFEQHIVAVLLDEIFDQMIDEARIDERRIGGHAHDDVGVEQFGGARKPRQHVVFRSAHDGHIVLAAEFDDGVVAADWWTSRSRSAR